jgi:hypothetical protein
VHIVKELDAVEVKSALHPRRRIVIIQRDDGWYTYAEQYYYVSEYDGEIMTEGWQTLRTEGLCATSQAAEMEGRAALARWHGLHNRV